MDRYKLSLDVRRIANIWKICDGWSELQLLHQSYLSCYDNSKKAGIKYADSAAFVTWAEETEKLQKMGRLHTNILNVYTSAIVNRLRYKNPQLIQIADLRARAVGLSYANICDILNMTNFKLEKARQKLTELISRREATRAGSIREDMDIHIGKEEKEENIYLHINRPIENKIKPPFIDKNISQLSVNKVIPSKTKPID